MDTGNEGGFRWMSEYEKTWEAIQEDDAGSLQAMIDDIIHKAKRKRLLVRKGNVRLGMMRHLYVMVDMSRAMDESDLLKPSRLACVTKLLEYFITEYFDQNPISQLGIIVTKNKRAERITDLSGNPRMHISSLQETACKGTHGEPSLQNGLEVALAGLRHLPSHASREVLILLGSLSTCDPGDIAVTIRDLKEQSIRCSVIGLSAEMFVCKKLCKETGGVYNVILDEKHLKDLLGEHVRPPEAKVNMEASLIRMGFAKHLSNAYPSFCMCHLESKLTKPLSAAGYFCPQCKSKYCELPVECVVCGLTLVSAPHLARSYQHLFPLPAFDEVRLADEDKQARVCQGCWRTMKDRVIYICTRCREVFCNDCDLFIHETLHTCPGCTSHKEVAKVGDN